MLCYTFFVSIIYSINPHFIASFLQAGPIRETSCDFCKDYFIVYRKWPFERKDERTDHRRVQRASTIVVKDFQSLHWYSGWWQTGFSQQEVLLLYPVWTWRGMSDWSDLGYMSGTVTVYCSSVLFYTVDGMFITFTTNPNSNFRVLESVLDLESVIPHNDNK